MPTLTQGPSVSEWWDRPRVARGWLAFTQTALPETYSGEELSERGLTPGEVALWTVAQLVWGGGMGALQQRARQLRLFFLF